MYQYVNKHQEIFLAVLWIKAIGISALNDLWTESTGQIIRKELVYFNKMHIHYYTVNSPLDSLVPICGEGGGRRESFALGPAVCLCSEGGLPALLYIGASPEEACEFTLTKMCSRGTDTTRMCTLLSQAHLFGHVETEHSSVSKSTLLASNTLNTSRKCKKTYTHKRIFPIRVQVRNHLWPSQYAAGYEAALQDA